MKPSKLFHPAVASWFGTCFEAPTPTQVKAWLAIEAAEHTLVAAPTCSGKTLAAFLAAINDLIRQGLSGTLANEIQVVYLSIERHHRNLEVPLAGISAQLRRGGLTEVTIRSRPQIGRREFLRVPRVGDRPAVAHAMEAGRRLRAQADARIKHRTAGAAYAPRALLRPPCRLIDAPDQRPAASAFHPKGQHAAPPLRRPDRPALRRRYQQRPPKLSEFTRPSATSSASDSSTCVRSM